MPAHTVHTCWGMRPTMMKCELRTLMRIARLKLTNDAVGQIVLGSRINKMSFSPVGARWQ